MASIVADNWRPCPTGELDRLETLLRWRRFWTTLGTLALAIAATLSLAAAAWVVADAVWPLLAPHPTCSPVVTPPPANQE
jgi:hypothetical protein